jgi:hypothetical protein
MATDAEIEAAVKAMRAIPLRGGTVHEDVLRAMRVRRSMLRPLYKSRNIAGGPSFWRTRQLGRSVKTTTRRPDVPADPQAHGDLAPSLAMARRPV